MERITSQLREFGASAIAHNPPSTSNTNVMTHRAPCTRISNALGVPGTLGSLARTLHDGRIVLLSTWHVLYGNGGLDGSGVWLIEEQGVEQTFSPLGINLYGKMGVVPFGDDDFYIDCAVASCESSAFVERGRSVATLKSNVAGLSKARLGSLVTKTGAATGTTSGIIVDTNYSADRGTGAHCAAPKQILIRSINSQTAFCAAGDSGALILDESKKAVGLLWGTNTRGEGVACAIEPVLHVLNIELALAGSGSSREEAARCLKQ